MSQFDELPEGWIETTLGEIILPFKTAQPGKEPNREFTYIDIGAIDNSIQEIVEPKRFLGKDAPSRARRIVKTGDVLFSTVRTYLKNIARVSQTLDGVLTSTGIAVLRPCTGINKDYLFYVVVSDDFIRKISRTMDGTLYPAVTDSDVQSAAIPLPPLNEQRRIVEKIEALTARSRKAREALEAIPNLLDQFRQSVLAAAFCGDLTADWREQNPDVEPAEVLLERIRVERRKRWEEAELEKMRAKGQEPKNDKWKEQYNSQARRTTRYEVAEIKASQYRLDDIPKTWKLARFSEVINLQPGYAFKSKWFTKNGIRLLRGTNIVPGGIRWEDTVYLSESDSIEYKDYLLERKDIVIAMDRPVISSGLKVAILDSSDLPALLLQRVGRFQIEQNIHPGYVFSFLNSPLFFSHIQDQATGTQLPHISKNDIESVLVPIPPYGEQVEIVRYINSVNERIQSIQDIYNSDFEELDQLDQSILAKAFRGELVPQDPNDEPAAVLLERIRAEREKVGKKSRRVKG